MRNYPAKIQKIVLSRHAISEESLSGLPDKTSSLKLRYTVPTNKTRLRAILQRIFEQLCRGTHIYVGRCIIAAVASKISALTCAYGDSIIVLWKKEPSRKEVKWRNRQFSWESGVDDRESYVHTRLTIRERLVRATTRGVLISRAQSRKRISSPWKKILRWDKCMRAIEKPPFPSESSFYSLFYLETRACWNCPV